MIAEKRKLFLASCYTSNALLPALWYDKPLLAEMQQRIAALACCCQSCRNVRKVRKQVLTLVSHQYWCCHQQQVSHKYCALNALLIGYNVNSMFRQDNVQLTCGYTICLRILLM